MPKPESGGNPNRIRSAKKADSTALGKYGRWREEIIVAEKEFRDFWRQGNRVTRKYMDEGGEEFGPTEMRKFNIFTANVGILQSVLYARIPKVTVTRRFNQSGDDVARVAALLLQNVIMQDMEEGEETYFDQVMREAVEDRLIPGMGTAWVRLETETAEHEQEAIIDPMTGTTITDAFSYEKVETQEVVMEHVHWSDFLYSPCRTWSERRWVARRVYMDYDALVERFGEEKAKQVPLDWKPEKSEDGNPITPDNELLQKATIYEIWDRTTKTVLWLSKHFAQILDEKEDPLELEDFDPCPRPLFATMTTSRCIPKSDYVIYQDQYDELNVVNNRISLLVAACKVVGCYDAAAKGVQSMFNEAVENTLVPVDNWAMFAEKGGIRGQVDWLPIDAVIAALERLRQAREDIKAQIYELTGISDIVRGNTKASETLGAQQIKAKFASVRIQKLQDEVARFAQQLFNYKAQIICKHFTPEQIIAQSNARFYPDAANDPVIQQAIALIKDEESFEWRIKVQADTLGQVDYDTQKQEKVEFTNAVATFLQSAATTMKAIPPSAPIIFETLKFAISGFKGASELEGVIDNGLQAIMADIAQQKAAAQNQPNPEQQKAQMEMQKMQAELQMDQQRNQADLQMKQAELAMKQQSHQQELAFKQQEHQLSLQQQAQSADMKMQADAAKFDQQLVQAQQKAMQQMVADARKDKETSDES